ncbi:hypothetical protein KY311_04935 [Candidatus Woesearchaeota archaeon]|nr:hypothetical protein [Candidatus Woesearchaeota archaeon]
MPFYLIADSVHQKDSVKRVHLSRIKEASNIVEKVMYSQIMDSYTAEVMSDCHEAASNNAFNFNEKYNKSHEDVRKAMHSMLKELVLGIDAKSVANFSNSLLFMHNADGHGLVSRGYTSIGEVNLISVEERRVIYEQNGIIFASGIQIPSKKEREKLDYGNSKHGRTNIETIVIRDFIEGLFNDREEAYSQLCSYVEDAAKLRFDLKYYIKAINVRSNLENMSDTELMKEDKQIIRHFKAKQDETIMSIQTVKGYAGYDPGEKKFFLMENGERKYIGDDEVRKILDMGYYREKIFGQKSRLYSLMKVAFDKKTRQHFKDHVNDCFTNSVA